MSTRCNIVIKDEYNELIFYRHSDGYPEGVADTLLKFMDWLNAGKIRDNVGQAAGWLIVMGAAEYDYSSELGNFGQPLNTKLKDYMPSGGMSGWKVGAYEPSAGIHGDIEYLYEIDLKEKSLKAWHHNGEEKGRAVKIKAKKRA